MRGTPTKIVTHANDCEYNVLASSTASVHEYDCERVFVCEYSRVFSSLALASFDSPVGKALLACARSAHMRVYKKFSVEA